MLAVLRSYRSFRACQALAAVSKVGMFGWIVWPTAVLRIGYLPVFGSNLWFAGAGVFW